MSKRWALVNGGTIQTIFDGEDDPNAYPDIASLLVEVDETVQCNWTYDGETFAAPVNTASRWISVSAFRKRFTQAQQVILKQASFAYPLLAVWHDDLLSAEGQVVNLDSPALTEPLHQLPLLLPEHFTTEVIAELLA